MTAGIYKIVCTATDNFYVGSSRDIQYRWRSHRLLLCRDAHHSLALQRAWNKHGAEAFRLEILEVVENDILLLEREQHHHKSRISDGLRRAYAEGRR